MTWVCEDPEVIELVNAAMEAYPLITSTESAQRLRDAAAAIRIPEDER